MMDDPPLLMSLELPNQLKIWAFDVVNGLLELKFQLQALAENRLPISDYSNTRPWLLFLFLAIVLRLGLLHLAENTASTSNANGEEDQSLKPEEQEQEQPSDLIVYSSEGFQQPVSRTATAYGGASVRRHRACVFCGNLSTTKCSRCKTARYCSEACQIRHWRSVHKYECVETEAVDEERHGGGASRTVKKTKKESSNGSIAVEWNSEVGDVDSNYNATRQPTDASGEAAGSSYSCAVCGGAATMRCSRCKAVKYCSAKCLIEDWGWHKVHCIAEGEDITQTQTPPLGNVGIGLLKNSNEEEDNDDSPGPLSLEFYPVAEGTTTMKPLVRSSQEPTKKAHDHTVEGLRLTCLEEELAKSRNEIMFLQSERDEWAMMANFAKERYRSFKKESEHQLFVLKNEKKLISNAEKQARNVVNSLWERLHYLQIAVEASNAEKGKQEEYIQTLESKCAQLKRELQEEREHVQGLTAERDESHTTAQIAMREVEEKGKELQRLREDFLKDVAAAELRAVEAERELCNLERKIRSTKNKVGVWTDILGRPAMACAICLTNEKDLAFGCGHMTCRECGSKITKCPICREQITSLVRLFPG